ncbi:CoA ester lyase [Streptomyces sp. ME02-6987-2C]|uniref:HpcH/HpaI aldolase/citrate lyase family protein n=1 Tax=unclassified Streptomyces TaxID=2593676 RepID=UPI0029BC01D4|nr:MULTISPECIES: CoA ester lyase [unclassified Streptomyces]MDX3367588.1 CoA ester lyase [Streptomyces sp. ME02-6987-2C]MDX3425801.1 CoA ester lyase [Streptomyces sp. ME02-6985-2c]
MTSTSHQPERAWIITPGLHLDRFASAQKSGAAVAVVDIEDSVAPADKQTARTASEAFFVLPDPPCTLGIRMNSLTTLDGIKDLTALAAYTARPDLIVIPKVESDRDIALVAAALDTDAYTPDIWALIESPRAFTTLPAILSAPRLGGVIFGSADYAASVRCGLSWEALHYARSALINAATAANLPAIDAPTWNLNDPDLLRRDAERAKELGFHGKGCVHPRHVQVINDVFTPTADEITQARAIVAAADASGGTVTTVDGQMRGTPFFNRARALVAEADRTS